jgi:hypothetical protein
MKMYIRIAAAILPAAFWTGGLAAQNFSINSGLLNQKALGEHLILFNDPIEVTCPLEAFAGIREIPAGWTVPFYRQQKLQFLGVVLPGALGGSKNIVECVYTSGFGIARTAPAGYDCVLMGNENDVPKPHRALCTYKAPIRRR